MSKCGYNSYQYYKAERQFVQLVMDHYPHLTKSLLVTDIANGWVVNDDKFLRFITKHSINKLIPEEMVLKLENSQNDYLVMQWIMDNPEQFELALL